MAKTFCITILLFFLLVRCSSNTEGRTATKMPGVKEQALIKMLGEIDYEDQRYRLELDAIMNSLERDSAKLSEIWKKIRFADSINRVRIFMLLDTAGWPAKSVIGVEGATTIWAVIQHAKDEDREKYFPVLQKAVQDSNLEAKYLAYTEDRIRTDKGLKQKYGTQFWQELGGKSYLQPVENPGKVDSLRNTVSLSPVSTVLKEKTGDDWSWEDYYRDLPKAEKILKEDRKRYLLKKENKETRYTNR
ncbi:DUF6624 domain-containing protein [Niabella sp. 22666]|uniref:DUF6624 domain-containing protein n=1 Tax=Niabella sp. 22666 TaxID=3453954 RepID=UPI003F879048